MAPKFLNKTAIISVYTTLYHNFTPTRIHVSKLCTRTPDANFVLTLVLLGQDLRFGQGGCKNHASQDTDGNYLYCRAISGKHYSDTIVINQHFILMKYA